MRGILRENDQCLKRTTIWQENKRDLNGTGNAVHMRKHSMKASAEGIENIYRNRIWVGLVLRGSCFGPL
jgi:hypothetical protein